MSSDQPASSVTVRFPRLFSGDREYDTDSLVFTNGVVTSTQLSDGSGRVLDFDDVVVVQGLTNAHTHLEFSDLPHPLGMAGMSLPDWIRLVVTRRRTAETTADIESCRRSAVLSGLSESKSSGVANIGEIATFPWSSKWHAPYHAPGVSMLELLSLDPGRVDDLLRGAQAHLDAHNHVGQQPSDGWLGGLSPHAPYSVHPRLLEEACGLSRSRQVPLAMHIAESREELELLQTGDGPFRRLLEDFGAWQSGIFKHPRRTLDLLKVLETADRALVVHGNYLEADEQAFLAEHAEQMALVYCPRTHDFFRHPPYPLRRLLDLGVRIALGTDSRASNPDLQIWNEFLFAAHAHPNVSPRELLRAATTNGSFALGISGDAVEVTGAKLESFAVVRGDADLLRRDVWSFFAQSTSCVSLAAAISERG